MRCVVLLFGFLACWSLTGNASPVPLVIWHGMGDSCCNPLSMGRIKSLVEKQVPGIYVLSLEIGANIIDDMANGFIMNANKQIEEACQKIRNDKNLINGFNAMGFSQGGQFLRAVVQRCSDLKMKNLISVGGQHQGVFGFPRCPGNQSSLCDLVRRMLNIGAYVDFVQDFLVQAEYWQDPFNEEEYRKKSVFLADINQELSVNETYKENLVKLTNLALVMFTKDTMVQPKESEWFGFYKPNQDKQVYSLFDSDLFKNDLLGLKALNTTGRLHFLEAPFDHLQFTEDWFVANLVPFIKS